MMRRLLLIPVCGVLTAALAGCHSKAGLTPQGLTPLQGQGQKVFAVGCAHCHVSNDQHIKPAPPDLRGLFTHKKLPDGEPATDAEVRRVLMTGKGMMPSFAYQMTPQQMAAVIAYLHVYGAAARR